MKRLGSLNKTYLFSRNWLTEESAPLMIPLLFYIGRRAERSPDKGLFFRP